MKSRRRRESSASPSKVEEVYDCQGGVFRFAVSGRDPARRHLAERQRHPSKWCELLDPRRGGRQRHFEKARLRPGQAADARRLAAEAAAERRHTKGHARGIIRSGRGGNPGPIPRWFRLLRTRTSGAAAAFFPCSSTRWIGTRCAWTAPLNRSGSRARRASSTRGPTPTTPAEICSVRVARRERGLAPISTPCAIRRRRREKCRRGTSPGATRKCICGRGK